jgi:hypothetical protein
MNDNNIKNISNIAKKSCKENLIWYIQNKLLKYYDRRLQITSGLNAAGEKHLINFVAKFSRVDDVTTGSCCSCVIVVNDNVHRMLRLWHRRRRTPRASTTRETVCNIRTVRHLGSEVLTLLKLGWNLWRSTGDSLFGCHVCVQFCRIKQALVT